MRIYISVCQVVPFDESCQHVSVGTVRYCSSDRLEYRCKIYCGFASYFMYKTRNQQRFALKNIFDAFFFNENEQHVSLLHG